jgi:hypothetical protein
LSANVNETDAGLTWIWSGFGKVAEVYTPSPEKLSVTEFEPFNAGVKVHDGHVPSEKITGCVSLVHEMGAPVEALR